MNPSRGGRGGGRGRMVGRRGGRVEGHESNMGKV